MLGWVVALFLAAMLWDMRGVAMGLQDDLESERLKRRISDGNNGTRRNCYGYDKDGSETITGSVGESGGK